jgi:hypothetical protein
MYKRVSMCYANVSLVETQEQQLCVSLKQERCLSGFDCINNLKYF